jgi:inorganic pyrophosphatase
MPRACRTLQTIRRGLDTQPPPTDLPSVNKIPLRVEGGYHVVVETPRGSGNKLKWNPKLGTFVWSRPLAAGIAYPFDWGFFPATRAPDGDPLDAFVLTDAPTFPGVVIECRPVAVLELEQNQKNRKGRHRNDRVLMVPLKAPRHDRVRDLADLPLRLREEFQQFFIATTLGEGKDAKILGWSGAATARRLIERSARRRA